MRPGKTRSENVSDEAKGDLSPNPAENSKTNQMRTELALGDPLSDLPEWLQELRESCGSKGFQNTGTHPQALLVSLLKNQWGRCTRKT